MSNTPSASTGNPCCSSARTVSAVRVVSSVSASASSLVTSSAAAFASSSTSVSVTGVTGMTGAGAVGVSSVASVPSTPLARLPRNSSRTPPAIPPNVAPSAVPAKSSATSLYCCSFRFCKNSEAASCPASNPPVSVTLRARSPKSCTVFGPSLSTNLDRTGISTRLTNRAMGSTSKSPIGAPRRAAALRSSSVAPASRARSLASPAAADTPSNPAAPVAIAAAGAAIGAAATAAPVRAAGTAIPAIEPNAEPNPLAKDSGSPPNSKSNADLILLRSSVSVSSSANAARPSDADSPTPTKPLPNPPVKSANMPVSSGSSMGSGIRASESLYPCLSSSARLATRIS